MQVFATYPDPLRSAEVLDDRRQNKLIIESAQILATALWHRSLWTSGLYKPVPNHNPHPSLWAAASWANYEWLLDHLDYLGIMYSLRASRQHKTHATQLPKLRTALPSHNDSLTPFTNCSYYPDWIDTHAAYRQTLLDKWAQDTEPPRWTGRQAPDFFSAAA